MRVIEETRLMLIVCLRINLEFIICMEMFQNGIDYYGNYDTINTVNPVGAISGSLRVNRGGSYNDFAKHLRSIMGEHRRNIEEKNKWIRMTENGSFKM